MMKRRDAAISKSDIETFITQTSDFELEMSVLRLVNGVGFSCDHAGTYRDPVTDKIRNYDFRGRRQVSAEKHVRLAIECKNIRPSSPLLVYATPRTAEESFHALLVRKKIGNFDFPSVQAVSGPRSVYPPDEPVGRSTDQVSRNQSGDFVGGDSVVFEKLLQALHSTQGLVEEAAKEAFQVPRVVAVIPIVVVPDGLLWQIDYGAGGALALAPRQVTRTTLMMRHGWVVTMPLSPILYTISHLEVITSNGLSSRLNYLMGSDGLFAETEQVIARS